MSSILQIYSDFLLQIQNFSQDRIGIYAYVQDSRQLRVHMVYSQHHRLSGLKMELFFSHMYSFLDYKSFQLFQVQTLQYKLIILKIWQGYDGNDGCNNHFFMGSLPFLHNLCCIRFLHKTYLILAYTHIWGHNYLGFPLCKVYSLDHSLFLKLMGHNVFNDIRGCMGFDVQEQFDMVYNHDDLQFNQKKEAWIQGRDVCRKYISGIHTASCTFLNQSSGEVLFWMGFSLIKII